jgi:hypothetical protein
MSFRRRACLAVAFAVVAVAAAGTSLAQPAGGGNDRVYYKDRKGDGSIVSKAGELKESPAGISVFAGGKLVATVPATDIVRVEYSSLPGLENADKQAMLSFDNKAANYSKKDATDARTAFAAMTKKALSDEKTRRSLEYREAVWTARAADFASPADFPKEAQAAAEKLRAVALATPKSWEPYPAAKLAARLYSEIGKNTEAAGVLSSVSKLKDLPPDLKADAKITELAITFRGTGKLAAETLIADLLKDKDFPRHRPGPRCSRRLPNCRKSQCTQRRQADGTGQRRGSGHRQDGGPRHPGCRPQRPRRLLLRRRPIPRCHVGIPVGGNRLQRRPRRSHSRCWPAGRCV